MIQPLKWNQLIRNDVIDLKQRLTAEPVRFVYQRDMPDEMVALLRSKLGLSNNDSVIAGGRYHNFKDFINFPNEGSKFLLNNLFLVYGMFGLIIP